MPLLEMSATSRTKPNESFNALGCLIYYYSQGCWHFDKKLLRTIQIYSKGMIILKWNFRQIYGPVGLEEAAFSVSSGADKSLSSQTFFISHTFSGVSENPSPALISRLSGNSFPAVFLPGPHPGLACLRWFPPIFGRISLRYSPIPDLVLLPSSVDHSEATFYLFCDRVLLPSIWNCSRDAISII